MIAASILFASSLALGQAPNQPKVQPGPSEPDWIVLLDRLYGLGMFDDLANPVVTTVEATPGRFRRAKSGPVRFTPILALGLEVPIRGGHYDPDGGADSELELWSYRHKSTAREIESGKTLVPPLVPGSKVEFDPGNAPFSLWVGNDQFKDRVYSEPARVKRSNKRLAPQPYKAMIYPYRDPKTRQFVPNSYLIGWEYSTNDDFQDVVCLVENVELIR